MCTQLVAHLGGARGVSVLWYLQLRCGKTSGTLSCVQRVGCTLYQWLILPELSTYYAIPAKQYIGKTPDFVRHFDTLIVIRYLSKKILNDLRPILFVFCNKHLGHITQKPDFWALEKGFSANFRPLAGFSRPKKTFLDKFDPNVFF